jgi:prevent-host-death family protein
MFTRLKLKGRFIMYKIIARPCRELRNNYPELVKQVKEHNQVIITNNGRDEAVLIGMDEFNAFQEFLHQQYIRRELEKARIEAADPNTKWYTHDEVWGGIKEKYGI